MMKYGYMGYFPYGAGELFCLDHQVEEGFDGNVVQQIIADGRGDFEIIDENRAVLKIKDIYDLPFVKSSHGSRERNGR